MVIVILVVTGLVLGSFVNAFAWRLHENKNWINGRSECPVCHHKLAAKDLVPVLSWLWLRGKCRYCKQKISIQYPLVELLTAGLFVFSYYFWPLNLHGIGLFQFVLWLIFLAGFIALAIYDLRWHMLPNKIVYPLIILAVIQVIIASIWDKSANELLSVLWGVIVLGGGFYVIFQISGGKWIGGGDVKFGALLGLIVGGPLASLLLLFIASCCGSLYAIPLVISGRTRRKTQVPFGPFLIIGAVVVRLFGASIIEWYKRLYT